MSYVSFKYSRAEKRVSPGSRGPSSPLTDWQTPQMNHVTPHPGALAAALCVETHCPRCSGSFKSQVMSFMVPSDWCPPLGILEPFSPTQLLVKFRDVAFSPATLVPPERSTHWSLTCRREKVPKWVSGCGADRDFLTPCWVFSAKSSHGWLLF